MVRAIDQIIKSSGMPAGNIGIAGVQVATPVAIEIPVCSANKIHVGINEHSGSARRKAARFRGHTVVETEPSAYAPHWRLLHYFLFFLAANFIVERIAVGEPDH